MQNRGLKKIILIVIFLLLLPLIAMQFTTKINWDVTDFIIAGILLFSFLSLLYFAKEKLRDSKYKVPIVTAIVIIFLLIWIELAVGIFGTPLAGS